MSGPSPRQVLGRGGEQIAEKYLVKKGYRLVERNYRCPLGELDLIALDRRVIVFVEVKTRVDESYGPPLESVHPRKQRKMIGAAQYFISHHKLQDREARFDVIGISFAADNPVIEHIENAFEVE